MAMSGEVTERMATRKSLLLVLVGCMIIKSLHHMEVVGTRLYWFFASYMSFTVDSSAKNIHHRLVRFLQLLILSVASFSYYRISHYIYILLSLVTSSIIRYFF